MVYGVMFNTSNTAPFRGGFTITVARKYLRRKSPGQSMGKSHSAVQNQILENWCMVFPGERKTFQRLSEYPRGKGLIGCSS